MKDVFFIRSRLTGKRSLLDRLEKLLEAAGLEFIRPRDLVGIKLSFGERGNTAFLRPPFVRRVVDTLKARGAKPFLTDSNTLYHGHRTNSVDHLILAEEHGFGLTQVGAPIIMADGLRSESYLETEVNLKHFRQVKVGSVVGEMDALVSLSHFKGHLACAFGGTLKNIGMGLGSRSMKQLMHSGTVRPEFSDRAACTGCARCATVCQYGAIHIKSGKAHFTYERCVGCAECIPACPEEALKILWAEKPEVLGEKIAETTYGVLHRLNERCLFVNFLLDITPDCDCFPYNDDPIVPDIGILASRDPVAIDQASVDLLNAEESIAVSQIGRRPAREDKLAALCPDVNWQRQLEYAEEIGLGSRRYRLVEM
ncbi:MAG TPA: DUF362 domain-containing protein [Acidobacteriota bacterium]|nr:DUF362 domain-containing protein [Acidobacteriota bacterium]HNR37466.1 DUF362 domain-containing protein [Acidobacteriota bacterium]HNT99661.1 DUF362 domain-containing protein [Acidobacteriota bacterium]HPB27069.1 DUF362 domain-containing protein [Acidobacteriota bacterium]HQO25484.1 DUF362 domain-containing protein [Acidobacteriota bacterium]